MLNPVRVSNVDVVKIEQVIHVFSVFGKGVEDDPVRVIHEYYTMEGNLIARIDPVKSAEQSVQRMGGYVESKSGSA